MLTLFQRKGRHRTKKDVFFAVFSTTLLLCCTINLASDCVFGEEWWIVNQNYPGGSAQWFADNTSDWYQTWATVANIVVQLLADAFLVSIFVMSSWAVEAKSYRSIAATCSGTMYGLFLFPLCCGLHA